jgi:elongation factor Ts
MAVTADQIKALRELSGAGVLDCRKALEASGGDNEKAMALLREKGLAQAAKRADREASNGVIDLYNHGEGRVGVMIEVNCETDFVARTREFRSFAHELALQVAAGAPRYVSVEGVPSEVVAAEQANARQRALDEGKPEAILPKIVEGRMEKFYDEVCLLRQVYIRDDSRKVGELLQEMIASTGEKITVRRFMRWALGEESA